LKRGTIAQYQAVKAAGFVILSLFLFGKAARYEAEHLYARDVCNEVVRDSTASNDSCRVAYVNRDSKGHMQYGPNIIFPPGYYTATFRMKISGQYRGINPICVIDITSRRTYPLKYHALRNIHASFFRTVGEWQDFKIGFHLNDTVDCFQLRVEWLDSVDLYIDYVDVTHNLDPESLVYAVNLQDMNFDLQTDVFDLRMADRRILLASVQGAVNRTGPRFVLLHNDEDYEGQGIYRWLYSFDVPYVQLDYHECIGKLVEKRYFKGCVLFDPGELDSSAIKDPPEKQKLLFHIKAIATNLAVLESLLIVTPKTIVDIDTNLFPVKYDLTNRRRFAFLNDSTGRQASDYNLRLFGTRNFNKELAFKLFPYMSMSPLRNAAEKLTDYAIQNKQWSFYADLRDGLNNSFLENNAIGSIHYLMGYCDEGVGEDAKYYNKEYEHIKMASEAGKLWIGDMNRIHNLSFFAGMKTDAECRQFSPVAPRLDRKIYISFLSMDGDNPVLLLKHFRKDWDSPRRGSIPVSWGFPPKMRDLAPSILQYYYETKTINDCIIADVSGLAWHLTNHFDFSDYPTMLNVTAKYLKALDIRVIKLMADRNADLVDVDYLQKVIKTYPQLGGFIEGYWPPKQGGFMMVGEEYPSIRLAINKPIVAFGDRHGVSTVVDAIKQFVSQSMDRPLFVPVIYNIYNPSYTIYNTLFDKLDSIVDILNSMYGDSVAYVRQDVMMDLIKAYYEASDTGSSRLFNRGFERGLDGWFASGNVFIDNRISKSGAASVQISGNSYVEQRVEGLEGAKYRLKVWLRPEKGSTGIFRVIWYADRAIASDTVFYYNAQKDTDDWFFYFRDIRAPSGTISARIFCEAKGGIVRFDDVEFKEVLY